MLKMTATIEPRLIHLLNESTTPQLSSADLPPLAQLPYPKSSDLPLPPIDSDPVFRSERNGIDGLSLINSSAPFATDDFFQGSLRDDGGRNVTSASRSYPVHSVLSDSDPIEPPPSSLSKILDDTPNAAGEITKKKRARGLNAKDDFMQLPQPVKKQKAAPQTHVMPPIINGLHEPPPHAALFPPIASSSSFSEQESSKLNFLQDLGYVPDERNQPLQHQPTREEVDKDDKCTGKAKKRVTKPRSKWSEEETKHLLLGVSKYGVGKWKNILGDPEYHFNDRSAGDLKDRFRTCCPDELRNSKKSAAAQSISTEVLTPKRGPKKGRDLDKILISVAEVEPDHGGLVSVESSTTSAAVPKKSRAHRKKMKDLAELGIVAPFRPSGRRERRPFTDEEDKQILEGLEEYGPAWTKIQRDPRFNLSRRQPTDLRDRVRNGYPSIYQRIEKGAFQAKGAGRSNDIMEPSVTTSIGNRLERPAAVDTQTARTLSREEVPRWPLQILDNTDMPLSPQQLEFGDGSSQSIMGGEMDISRLLLDEPSMG